MDITKEDIEVMRKFDGALEKLFSNVARELPDYVIFPMGIFLGCNKSMALDIYKTYKQGGLKVYFVSSDGLWLLDHKGDINLVQCP